MLVQRLVGSRLGLDLRKFGVRHLFAAGFIGVGGFAVQYLDEDEAIQKLPLNDRQLFGRNLPPHLHRPRTHSDDRRIELRARHRNVLALGDDLVRKGSSAFIADMVGILVSAGAGAAARNAVAGSERGGA